MAAKKKASKKKAAKKKATRKKVEDGGEFKVERGWLNKGEMAASLGISVQAFDKWGVKPVAQRHKYGEAYFTVADVIKNRLAWQARKFEQSQPQMDAAELMQAKEQAELEWTKERAEGQRLKNAAMRRELAPVEMVTWAIGRVCSEISAQLETIPGKVKRALPKLTSSELQLIKREVVKAQNTASEDTSLDWDEFDADFTDPRSD